MVAVDLAVALPGTGDRVFDLGVFGAGFADGASDGAVIAIELDEPSSAAVDAGSAEAVAVGGADALRLEGALLAAVDAALGASLPLPRLNTIAMATTTPARRMAMGNPNESMPLRLGTSANLPVCEVTTLRCVPGSPMMGTEPGGGIAAE